MHALRHRIAFPYCLQTVIFYKKYTFEGKYRQTKSQAEAGPS
jgi:hypothetical protein